MHVMQPRVVPNTATTGLIQPELHCSATDYSHAALFRSTVIAAFLIPKTRDHLFECKSPCPIFQNARFTFWPRSSNLPGQYAARLYVCIICKDRSVFCVLRVSTF